MPGQMLQTNRIDSIVSDKGRQRAAIEKGIPIHVEEKIETPRKQENRTTSRFLRRIIEPQQTVGKC